MKNKCLYEEFKHFEGQPVKIFTDDEKVHCGIDLNAFEDAVRIIDKCGRLELIDYSHIAAVVEPQMRLKRCCHDHCECREDREYDGDDYDDDDDDDCDRDSDEFRRRRRY